jgi:hypothetical protein
MCPRDGRCALTLWGRCGTNRLAVPPGIETVYVVGAASRAPRLNVKIELGAKVAQSYDYSGTS